MCVCMKPLKAPRGFEESLGASQSPLCADAWQSIPHIHRKKEQNVCICVQSPKGLQKASCV